TLLHPHAVAAPRWPSLLTGLAFTIVRDPGPLGEEFGWRGFALPQLLERHSPLRATFTLGLIHTAWHLPLFFIPGMPQTPVSLSLFTLGVISIAIFDTALYLRTGANLLLAILVHLMAKLLRRPRSQRPRTELLFRRRRHRRGVGPPRRRLAFYSPPGSPLPRA